MEQSENETFEAICQALTPGSLFNQNNNAFRSLSTLAQFACCSRADALKLLSDRIPERLTIKPSAKGPNYGPLIAITEYIPVEDPQEAQAGNPVKIIAGNAIAPEGVEMPVETPDENVALGKILESLEAEGGNVGKLKEMLGISEENAKMFEGVLSKSLEDMNLGAETVEEVEDDVEPGGMGKHLNEDF